VEPVGVEVPALGFVDDLVHYVSVEPEGRPDLTPNG
jgi:hypothetical protein